MIKAILRLVEWLDRKFPPKLVITVEDYERLSNRIDRCAKDAGNFHDDFMLLAERVNKLDESIRAIKDILSKGGATAVKPESDKLRDQFVRGELNRLPTRAEVESRS